MHLIKSTCPSLLITNLDHILCKNFKAFSEIHVRLEDIICEEFPPLREITYNLKIMLRDIDGDLDI